MKKILFIILILFLILIPVSYLKNRHITAVFDNVRPFDCNIPVYYKGILIGKTSKLVHSDDSKRTNVKLTIYNKKLVLPLNTRAVLKKQIKNDKESDYIELIYPDIPSERNIKEFSHIHGSATVDVKEYLKNQSPEDLEHIKINLLSASGNLNSSLEALAGMFILIQDVLQENRGNLKGSSHNLNKTAENINHLTKKIDNIIVEEQWKNTFNNIENSTEGFHNITNNINNTINDFDRTMPSTMQNANEITSNFSSITCGIRQTLSKNFGGLRLFFGKVINE